MPPRMAKKQLDHFRNSANFEAGRKAIFLDRVDAIFISFSLVSFRQQLKPVRPISTLLGNFSNSLIKIPKHDEGAVLEFITSLIAAAKYDFSFNQS